MSWKQRSPGARRQQFLALPGYVEVAGENEVSRGGGGREAKDSRDKKKAGEGKLGGPVAFHTQEALKATHTNGSPEAYTH